MAYVQAPPPDAHKVLEDLAKLIAASYKERITIIVETSGGTEESTTVIDKRLCRAALAAQEKT